MKNRYLMLAVIYIAGLAAPINQFKVPPLMQQLMKELSISLSASGWLMSVFALVGLLGAIPAGIWLKRLNEKTSILTALMLVLSGSLMGTMSGSAAMMLTSRFLEGAGMCIISIAAPSAIAALFKPEERGRATGIWMTWVPVGTMVIYNLAPLLSPAKWQHVWWFTSAYTAAALILVVMLLDIPAKAVSTIKKAEPISKNVYITAAMLAAIFMLLNVMTISIKTYLPAFLELKRNYSPVAAAAVLNIMIIMPMISGPLSGLISDRAGSRKLLLITGTVMTCVSIPIIFTSHGLLLTIGLFLIGVACGNIAPTTFTAASELDSKSASTSVSIVAFGQYAGMTIGPVFFSTTAEAFGWNIAGWCLLPVALLALALACLVKIK